MLISLYASSEGQLLQNAAGWNIAMLASALAAARLL